MGEDGQSEKPNMEETMIPMTDPERFDAYMRLADLRMTRWKVRNGTEWRMNIASIFLPERTVLAYVIQRGHAASVLRARGVPLLADTRLVVVVDGTSAAASEIVAGAVKSARRATVIGEKSAGTLGGSVTLPLPEGGMQVTVERILGPRNEQVDGVGITPDMLVTLTATDMEVGQDTQLDAALRALSP